MRLEHLLSGGDASLSVESLEFGVWSLESATVNYKLSTVNYKLSTGTGTVPVLAGKTKAGDAREKRSRPRGAMPEHGVP